MWYRLRRLYLILILVLLPLTSSWAWQGPALRVFLDITEAPDAGDFAVKTNALLVQWAPKINEALYDSSHPLPFPLIVVVFEPTLPVKGAPALATGNQLLVDSNYIHHMPDDYRAMMIHELTHIIQHYPTITETNRWLVEGIADYVRHKLYERDIQPTLRLNDGGRLVGYTTADPFFYNLQVSGVDLTARGYMHAYTVASNFLFWLEKTKDGQIVHRLNLALAQGQYSPDLFRQYCGKSLDDLWGEFVAQSKSAVQNH